MNLNKVETDAGFIRSKKPGLSLALVYLSPQHKLNGIGDRS